MREAKGSQTTIDLLLRPVSRLLSWSCRLPVWRLLDAARRRRPFLAMWAVLGAGMVAMMVAFSLAAGLSARQMAILGAVTVGLAGLCSWIVFLEHGQDAQ